MPKYLTVDKRSSNSYENNYENQKIHIFLNFYESVIFFFF